MERSNLSQFLEEKVLPGLCAEDIFSHAAHHFHKSNGKWRGGCPWHHSTSGTSFVVDPRTKQWWCAGCSVGGGPIQYLWKMRGGAGTPRGADFLNVVHELADTAGVAFPEFEETRQDREEAQARESRRALLQTVISYAREKIPEDVRQYLHSRGFDDEATIALGIGFYPDVEGVKRALERSGHSLKDAERAGVLWKKLEGYILFPWCDEYGNHLTLYGTWQAKNPPLKKSLRGWVKERDKAYAEWNALPTDEKDRTPWQEPRVPKKIALPNPKDADGNTFESTKRSPLYFDRARRAGHKEIVLVEGVTDAALLQSRGDTRVVACVGAQLSRLQAETLKKHQVERVIICLDPDSAGDAGILSCIHTLAERNMAPFVAPRLPDNLDPDEFVARDGIEAWNHHIAEAIHGYRHIARAICAKHGGYPQTGMSDVSLDLACREASEFCRRFSGDWHRRNLEKYFFPEWEKITGLPKNSIFTQSGEVGSGRFPDPVPFNEIEVPRLSEDILPGWAGDYAKAATVFLQVPYELVLANILGVITFAGSRKFLVEIREDHLEQLNLYLLCPLPPGERKSRTMSLCLQPLEEVEKRLRQEAQPLIQEAISYNKTIERTLETKRRKYASSKHDGERAKIMGEIKELEASLKPMPQEPRFLADDITVERTSELMFKNDQRIAIISAEAGIFDILSGRYQNGMPNLDLFLKSYSGDSVRVDRKMGPPIHMDNPALTMCLTPQPIILKGLAERPGFRGRGLLGRFLYFMPPSLVGHRKIDSPTIPGNVKYTYQRHVKSILQYHWNQNSSGERIPHVLKLSEAAFKEWCSFWTVVEREQADGGKFEGLRDWATRIPGAVGRIAGAIHIAAHAGREIPPQIEEDSMQRALTLGADLCTHTLAAFQAMGLDPATEAAKHILGWIKRNVMKEFTARECHRGVMGRYPKAPQVAAGLAVLEERAFIFHAGGQEKHGPGRPPAQSYKVNPKVWG